MYTDEEVNDEPINNYILHLLYTQYKSQPDTTVLGIKQRWGLNDPGIQLNSLFSLTYTSESSYTSHFVLVIILCWPESMK